MFCLTLDYWLNLFISFGNYLVEHIWILLTCWPFTLLLIILFLKDSINSLISRINEVHVADKKIIIQPNSVTNGLLTKSSQSSDPIEKNGKRGKSPLPKLSEDFIFKKVMETQETIIKDMIKSSPFKKEELLIRELASYQLAVDYERIYQFIFKSQIDALEGIINSANGKNKQDIVTYYEQAQKQYSAAYEQFSFDNWMYFLISHGLIEENSNRYYATEKGKAFVYYITEQQHYNWLYKSL